jgi:hypothetical protein
MLHLLIVAGQNYRLGIEINADASRVKFLIDGSIVQTHTTNIPTGAGRQTALGCGVRKTAGTTSVNGLSVDHVLVQHTLTNPLWT